MGNEQDNIVKLYREGGWLDQLDDIHALWINRIQDWLEPHQSRCWTYNFLADIRLDAVDTPEFGTVVSGEATHSFTTNATRITVTEKRRWESNGVKHIELDFCRDC